MEGCGPEVQGEQAQLPARLVRPLLADLAACSPAGLDRLARELPDADPVSILAGEALALERALFARLYGRAAVLLAQAIGGEGQGNAEDYAARIEMLVAVLRSSATLREAVRSMGRFNAMLPDRGIAIAEMEGDGHDRVAIDLAHSLPDPPHSLVAVSIVFIVNALAWLSGSPPALVEIGLRAVPETGGDPCLEMLGVPVRFGQDANFISLAEGTLALPVRADPRQQPESLDLLCHDPSFLRRMASPLAVRIQAALLDMTERQGRCPDRMAVCAWTGLSPSSLHRRLAAEGTCFSEVKAAWQRDMACDWIARGDRMDDIGRRLGFRDARSFRRAFIVWTGRVPSAMRSAREESFRDETALPPSSRQPAGRFA